MLFSKSFGYAMRGLLYIALVQDQKRNIQLNEIAVQLGVPRHFMAKILKRLVKEGLLCSVKGPQGGFSLNQETLDTSVLTIIQITDGFSSFKNCVLRYEECSKQNPCPMHYKIEEVKYKLQEILKQTKLEDLLQKDNADFIESIATFKDAGADVHPIFKDNVH